MEMDKGHALNLLAEVMAFHGAASEPVLHAALRRAEARAGIASLSRIDEEQMGTLLLALAAEGGRIQRVAETIAAWRTEGAQDADFELTSDAA